jgi:hypothetical protein
VSKTTIELDIPTDPAERARRQEEYNRMKAPLPDWLGPDTPERREDLAMFVQMMNESAFEGEPEYEPIREDDPAVLKGLAHMYRVRADIAETELDELKKIAPAHRAVVPVVTMQAIAAAICKRVEELQGKNLEGVDPHNLLLLTGGQLNRIIMQEFDKELG